MTGDSRISKEWFASPPRALCGQMCFPGLDGGLQADYGQSVEPTVTSEVSGAVPVVGGGPATSPEV
jgi:hypothetical protein